jgi:drug/metabolite transporter (DMT)-like permease
LFFQKNGVGFVSKGKLYLISSAIIYGILPFLTSVAYRGGVNGITLTFLRSVMSLPLLFTVIKANGHTLKVSARQLEKITVLAVFGGVMPLLTLYMSYNYISTGLASTLHFIYPLIIILSSAVIYHQRPSRRILSAVVFVTVGIFMFADINTVSNKIGIVLAVLSGVFYSFYVIYIDRSGLDKMDFIVLTFYVSLIMSIALFVFALISGKLSFDMSPLAWSFSAVISLAANLGAMPLFQLGVRLEGAEAAGILSTVEPITSVALGALLLGESVGAEQIMGGAMILLGVIIAQRKSDEIHKTA